VLERIQKATTESQIEELQKLLSYIDQKIKIFNELKKLPLRDLTTQTAINAEASRQAELIKSR